MKKIPVVLFKVKRKIFIMMYDKGIITGNDISDLKKKFSKALKRNLDRIGVMSLVLESLYLTTFKFKFTTVKSLKWVEDNIAKKPLTICNIQSETAFISGLETLNNDVIKTLYKEGEDYK